MSQKQTKLKVIIHDFGLSRDPVPNATRCFLGTWEVIGNESRRLERLYGLLYVHFGVILGYKSNDQTGTLEAFQGNKNGFKHPHNVTIHVDTPTKVSGEKYERTWRSPKMSLKQPKLKVIIHAFSLYRDPSSERHGMPPRDMGCRLKWVKSFGTNIWMALRLFRGNFRLQE